MTRGSPEHDEQAAVADAQPFPDRAQPFPDPAQPFLDGYVRDLKAMGAIQSAKVERAFRTVARHRLLETFYHRSADATRFATIHHHPDAPLAGHLEIIYSDHALVTRLRNGSPSSSTSQPGLVASMLEFLHLGHGMKVLEIGAGTGYNAALMAEIVGSQALVVTVDACQDVAEQTRRLLDAAGYPDIRVLLGDGADGVPQDAPFDRVVATVGCSDLSPQWARQLRDDGLLLVPLEHAGGHPLVLLHKDGGQLRGRIVAWSGFMPATGPLHIEDLWARGLQRPDEPPQWRPPWPGFGAAGPAYSMCGESADEIGLLFFAGLHDRRACWAPQGVGLTAGPDGWAAAGPDGIWWWQDPSLADELDRLHQLWTEHDRPGLADYELSFAPRDDPADPAADGWRIERRFFAETVQLATCV